MSSKKSDKENSPAEAEEEFSVEKVTICMICGYNALCEK
jgi:hypothetical protein